MTAPDRPTLFARIRFRDAGTLLGLVLIGLAATGAVGWWGWLGVVLLATGAIGWCPPYALFGWSTCATKGKA